ncbi:MAG TPA: aminotransferase [Gaiellales bacterium]|nr:aminotransferase [Gaiellales bacterium]
MSGGLFEGYAIESPPFGEQDGRRLAAELFGLDGTSVELGSHQDRNFLITTDDGRRAVLKIANPHFGRGSLEMQNAAMRHVAAAGLPYATPVPLDALDGRDIVEVDNGGSRYDVRMTSWVDGEPLTAARHVGAGARAAVGAMAAEASLALREFDHPAADRVLQWDLKHARAVVDGLVDHVPDAVHRELVEQAMRVHDEAIARLAPALRMQIIHGDVTDYNVVCRPDGEGRLMPAGLIDFGDMTRSYLAAEPAVAAAALMWHDADDALDVLVDVVRAFHARLPLEEPELAAMFPLVLARCASSAVSTQQQALLEPDNAYTSALVDGEWATLRAAASVQPAVAEAACRAACGLPAHPRAAVAARSLAARAATPVVDPAGRSLQPVDLSTEAEAYAFGEWRTAEGLAGAVSVADGSLAVGRYGESRLHRAGDPAERPPAAVHLGVDVFAREGEPVCSPLDGRLVSRGDGSVTLEVDLGDAGPCRLVLDGVEPAADLAGAARAGSVLGTVAPRAGRPPHVHVQICLERIDGLPGWATVAERDAWLALCPDPSPLVGVAAAAAPPERDRLLALRRHAVAGAQELYFREPPRIVRGWRNLLYDEDARPYLDMVNNVAVLGHSHPAVAAAAQRALRTINTNSRFNYDAIARFAERLVELAPEPLDQVFFVNTGSEANDLALRLARTYTGREEVIAVAGAYHGWTTATYAVSTAPYDNPAAAENPPPGLRLVPAADTYRGPIGPDEPDAGRRYAEYVRDAAPGAAAFICEPVLGNWGGIFAPDGYLDHAFRHVREAGGVCIADEVQVGYGRLGAWFWAFEQQGAVPDIITIAKSTGNGHPVGAVITTTPIAEAFARNASFFSSVGGSPLSCEIGMAVLDVMRDERLQENALRVGTHLRDRLRELAGRHPLIGAVHGHGLYLGAELVRDRPGTTPATEEAYAICERMRELGVIVQPTGERMNVLKIKPPLCIPLEAADRFADALDRVLTDGW